MKKILLFSFISIFLHLSVKSQEKFEMEEIRINRLLRGTLLAPPSENPLPLVLIIAGSGPTDRDGNQPMMKNNSLRFLAEGLYKNNIASFRYDKRIISLIENRNLEEKNIRFTQFIDDAAEVLKYFKKDERFSQIYILGHSQGSLIGMVAAQQGADGFISLAGAGQEIDDVIVDQLQAQAPALSESARLAFDELRTNGLAAGYDPGLSSIFRKEIQPFLLSWMQYNPQEEIKLLEMPILLINGDKDFQVQLSELELLSKARPDAESVIIKNMNHVLKHASDMGIENQKTYNIHNLPIVPELIQTIAEFISKNE